MLAAAPCTAMVFVWPNLVDGDEEFTLSQVALDRLRDRFGPVSICALLATLALR